MKTPLVNRVLYGLAALAVFPAAYIILSFLDPGRRWLLTMIKSTSSLVFLRFAAMVFLLFLVLLFLFREQVERILLRLIDDFYRVTTEAEGLLPPQGSRLVGWTLVVLALLVGIYTIWLAVTDVHAYDYFIGEDGIIESGSSVLWFLAALLLAGSYLMERRFTRVKTAVYLSLILFFIVCGGEEISWGQRLIGFQGPEALRALNKQHEINLHDMGSISLFANVFFLITIVFFIVLPYLQKRYPGFSSYLRYYDTPVLDPFAFRIYMVSLIVWVIVGIRFGTLGFSPFSLWGYYTQMDDEIFEFLAAYSFFSFAALDLALRLRDRRIAGRPQTESGV